MKTRFLNNGGRKGNYLEGSGSAMFAYAFTRGANKNYLDKKFLSVANTTFDGIIKELITVDNKGDVTMHNICGGCGGNPYRDGPTSACQRLIDVTTRDKLDQGVTKIFHESLRD